jgi:hypothetical protein
MGLWHRRRGARDGQALADVLRFGIQFSDGRKATNLDGAGRWDREQGPDGITLMRRGAQGGGQQWSERLWTCPLPPPGDVLFACEWPAQGVDLKTTAVDAELILAAATRARELWPAPDLPERPSATEDSGSPVLET